MFTFAFGRYFMSGPYGKYIQIIISKVDEINGAIEMGISPYSYKDMPGVINTLGEFVTAGETVGCGVGHYDKFFQQDVQDFYVLGTRVYVDHALKSGDHHLVLDAVQRMNGITEFKSLSDGTRSITVDAAFLDSPQNMRPSIYMMSRILEPIMRSNNQENAERAMILAQWVYGKATDKNCLLRDDALPVQRALSVLGKEIPRGMSIMGAEASKPAATGFSSGLRLAGPAGAH